MHAYIDFDSGPVFAIPARDGWHGFTGCEGMLLEGPQGWGEFSPPAAVAGVRAARYLTAAIEAGTVGWPDPVRGRVAVAVAVPAVLGYNWLVRRNKVTMESVRAFGADVHGILMGGRVAR